MNHPRRLTKWAEDYHIYLEAHAGCREHMCTVDNILVLHGVINHPFNDNEKVYVAFMYITKAFDYVVRENMWFKLLKYGVRGKMINIIESMYNIIKARVKYDNHLSNDFTY